MWKKTVGIIAKYFFVSSTCGGRYQVSSWRKSSQLAQCLWSFHPIISYAHRLMNRRMPLKTFSNSFTAAKCTLYIYSTSLDDVRKFPIFSFKICSCLGSVLVRMMSCLRLCQHVLLRLGLSCVMFKKRFFWKNGSPNPSLPLYVYPAAGERLPFGAGTGPGCGGRDEEGRSRCCLGCQLRSEIFAVTPRRVRLVG